MKRVLASVIFVGLAACHSAERLPTATGLASEVGLGLNSFSQATISYAGLIVFQGDDLLYGTSTDKRLPGGGGSTVPRSRMAVPDQVFKGLGKQVSVKIRSLPDSTVRAGVEHWKGEPRGDLLVLSYSYGDAKAGTSQADYRQTLTAFVAAMKDAGTPVFLIVPPPSADPALDQKLEPYRIVMRELARSNTAVFEAGRLLSQAGVPPSKSTAQSDAAYSVIAGGLLPYIKVVPRQPTSTHR